MRSLAKITEGQFLPLSSANLLSKVIVGGAIEEISMNNWMQEVEEDVKVQKESGIDVKEEEVVKRVTEKLQAQKVQTNQLKLDSIYSGPLDETNVTELCNAKSLKELKRGNLKTTSVSVSSPAAPPSSRMSATSAPSSAPSPSAPQMAEYSKASITSEQVQKMYSKAKKQNKF